MSARLTSSVPVEEYITYWSNPFNYNSTYKTQLSKRADTCNYTTYLSTHLTFPPPQSPQPILPNPYETILELGDGCDIFHSAQSAALLLNPCFNIYHITTTCPRRYSQLGKVNAGDYTPPGQIIYFNRTDVQRAINAPASGTNWTQCTSRNVFGRGTRNPLLADESVPPAQNDVLGRVIDRINNTFIGVGDLDFLLPTNGTLLALQNVTWGGKRGFEARPDGRELFVPYHDDEGNQGAPSAAGEVGRWGSERGLVFYNVWLAGHGESIFHSLFNFPSSIMSRSTQVRCENGDGYSTLTPPFSLLELPAYSPGAAYRVLEAMLGRIGDLSERSSFSTQRQRQGGGNRGPENRNASAKVSPTAVSTVEIALPTDEGGEKAEVGGGGLRMGWGGRGGWHLLPNEEG